MKGLRFVLLLISINAGLFSITFAQQAMFEHPVYFEDGLGNRDTVIIGGDTTAALGLNPEFGEIPLNTPFDSVFEVRTISEIEWWKANPILTKKYIGWSEKVFGYPEPCENIEFVRFVIHIKHLPLKVSWDSNLYSDSLCILSSYITSGAHAINIGPWTLSLNPEDENLAYCVAQHDSIVLDLGQGLYPGNLYEDFIYEIEGGITDTMLILQWDFDYSGSSLVCGEIVSTNNVISDYNTFKIFPNPALDDVTLEWENIHDKINDIQIYNNIGQLQSNILIKHVLNNSAKLDISALGCGLYFISLISEDKILTSKLIKY